MNRRALAVFPVVLTVLVLGRQAPAEEQTVCPVMEGEPISKDVFVEYSGKRVYFCCDSCKAKFLEEPDKYLHSLPQFAGDVTRQKTDEDHEEKDEHSGAAALMEPLGICTLVLLVATSLLGFLLKRNRKLLLPWHQRLAVATLVAGAVHALSVFLWD